MTSKKRTQTPQYQWEQALIDAYYDHRWREILEPLASHFERWKAGEIDHEQISQAIHLTYKHTQKEYNFFNLRRDMLVRYIQLDEEWFQAWVNDNPAPPGYPVM